MGPGVLDEHDEAIAKPNQEKEMHGNPGEPGQKAGEVHWPDIGHRKGTSHRRQGSLVNVPEWPAMRFPGNLIGNDLRQIASLLYRQMRP